MKKPSAAVTLNSKSRSQGRSRVLKPYEKFESINGQHPWMEKVPRGAIGYHVRVLPQGKVTYFNFNLAKEMGLIQPNHPQRMNRDLEKAILNTFNIRIINEFDLEKGNPVKGKVKPFPHMATRYLQLQHENKQGKTSGDGRSIWNGVFKGNGKVWDVASRGTGVTCLAPGSVESQKPIQTGDETFGYGCGLLELDELYATAVYSEIFHLHNIKTERVLAIIDSGNGHGIGVRVGQNLFRPAHLFGFLKQNDLMNLKRAADFLINRQLQNREWNFANSKYRYRHMLDQIAKSFARFAARLDVDYIFAWLDWDGDNVLFDAGIIDYGSIRQFGVRHDEYRYDDVDRLSTTLSEQKHKARFLVQVFAQITEFLETGKRPPLKSLRSHVALEKFDQEFASSYLRYRLYNVGFQTNDQHYLMDHHRDKVERFEKIFRYFERQKTSKKPVKLPDGFNRPAIFNMRTFLREYPKCIQSANEQMVPEDLFKMMMVEDASRSDRKPTSQQLQKLKNLQDAYKDLVQSTRRNRSFRRVTQEIENRSRVINRSDRLTGNGIIAIVDEIMELTKRTKSPDQIQAVIQSFVKSQVLLPKHGLSDAEEILKRTKTSFKRVLKSMLALVHDYREDI